MARIAGVDLPRNKRIEIALTYLYGIGRVTAQKILDKSGVGAAIRTDDLTEDQVAAIRNVIESDLKVEGDLRRDVQMNIKRLMDLGCYRGLRHRRGLPVRGQRTHTNARTRKGPRRGTVANKKKATSNFKYDKKTGQKKRKNPTLQRRAKKAAMKRRGKHLKASTRRKIAKSVRKTVRTGRIGGGKGRRVKR